MIPVLRLFLFAALIAASAASAGRAADLPYGQGLLWRVAKDGAVNHVFATVHSSDERVVELPRAVARAFGAADSLSLEMVTGEEENRKLSQAMLLEGGRTLERVLGSELFAAAVRVGARYGLPESSLRLFKPWVLFSFFSQTPAEFRRLAGGAAALDERLEQLARARGIPVYGLESVDEQIAVFDGLPEADQVALLQSALAQNPRVEELMEGLFQSYLAGDIAAILVMMSQQTSADDEALMKAFERRFVTDRNHRMVERMLGRLAEGGAFVAVGALHLPGEEGILRLLERRGFAIARVD